MKNPTPKPWKAINGYIHSGSTIICKTNLTEDIPDPNTRPTSSEEAANEDLICAAPELQEIVDTFVSLFPTFSKKELENIPFALKDLLVPAEASIKKSKKLSTKKL